MNYHIININSNCILANKNIMIVEITYLKFFCDKEK